MTMSTISSQHPVEPPELMAYLDGELSPDRAAETASHLEDCRECQSLAADLGFVAQKLIEWQIEAPEPKLSERLTEELDGRQREKPNNLLSKHGAQVSSLKPRLLWTGGAVAVFVVVLAMSMSKMMMRNRIAF